MKKIISKIFIMASGLSAPILALVSCTSSNDNIDDKVKEASPDPSNLFKHEEDKNTPDQSMKKNHKYIIKNDGKVKKIRSYSLDLFKYAHNLKALDTFMEKHYELTLKKYENTNNSSWRIYNEWTRKISANYQFYQENPEKGIEEIQKLDMPNDLKVHLLQNYLDKFPWWSIHPEFNNRV